jgi:RNA polymerase sigma factor (sigma-70 family)
VDDRASARTPSIRLDQRHLEEVVARCREERGTYRRAGERASPWCMELFRRAFAHDQDAWEALCVTFEPLVRTWVGRQHKVEHDDVLQETFLAFARYAPNHPDLVGGEEPDRVLTFLRLCAKSALLRLLRQYHEEEDLDQQVVVAPTSDDAGFRDAIRERLKLLLETEEERRVFYLRFECDMKPQQIAELYSKQFPDVRAIYEIVQRITRRLRKDATIRALYGLPPIPRQKPDSSVSLEIRTIMEDEDQLMPEERCALSEALLLDYITGAASPDLRLSVERSPGCRAAAHRLARELRPLLRHLYRMSCPDPEALIAYQEQRLDGTAQLAIHRHVAGCPLCQEECVLLAEIDAAALTPVSGLVRRVVEAFFQSPLGIPQPVRGELLRYQTPQILISLNMRKAQGKPRTWTLRGQIRTPDGQRVAGVLDAALLRPLHDPEQGQHQGTIEANGSFVFRGLPAGGYSLSLLMVEEEILIRRIVIGDDA